MRTPILSLALLAISIGLFSCDHGRVTDDTNTSPREIATSGTWRVTLFSERGSDETGDFAGYNFTFNTGGTITVTKSGVTTTGTWSVGSDDGMQKFTIDLGPKTDTNKPLGELTDDWKILSSSPTEIRLSDDNTSSDEFLTFTKN